jgi:glycosyltransferase involved in cell wall biosynthesis
MERPLFSIVIPTYNRQDLVPYAIQSVLWQNFGDYELIVCDNYSTDNTFAAVNQFKDSRIKYIRTPQHFVIADSFEFSRKHAKGKMVLMMSDDDALVPTALESFYEEIRQHDAEFIFSQVAEYRDSSFPGLERNILDCPPFSGVRRIVQQDEFLSTLFSFTLAFSMHPSSFVFSSALANRIANRTGRFFQTNGIEFFAWPVAAILSNKIVFIDLPLVVVGRTQKSWGSNIVFCNPGKEKIKKLIDDVEQMPKHAPLSNFTYCNLIAEGLLTAKKLYAKEFEKYIFDEVQYIIKTMDELERRRRLGVDVSMEIDEVKNYLRKNPSIMREVSLKERKKTIWRKIRIAIGDLGVRRVKERIRIPLTVRKTTVAGAEKVKRGQINSGIRISGGDFGINNILECTKLLSNIIPENCNTMNLN